MSEERVLYHRERVWNEKTCEIAWTIITYSRRKLGLVVSPCIASSFAYLHTYFEQHETTPFPNYMLLTTSLYLATKIHDFYRPFDLIFQEVCQTSVAITKNLIPAKTVQFVMGVRDFTNTKVTDSEKNLISEIEICLLNSIKWDFNIDLSFNYLTKYGNLFEGLDQKTSEGITDSIIRDLCICARSPSKLHYNQEIVCVAGIIHSFGQNEFSPTIKKWIDSVRENNQEIIGELLKYMIEKSAGIAKPK